MGEVLRLSARRRPVRKEVANATNAYLGETECAVNGWLEGISP